MKKQVEKQGDTILNIYEGTETRVIIYMDAFLNAIGRST